MKKSKEVKVVTWAVINCDGNEVDATTTRRAAIVSKKSFVKYERDDGPYRVVRCVGVVGT